MSNHFEMPLVVGKNNDGPYDELPFVAGMTLARIDMMLALNPLVITDWAPSGLLPQLDLTAMFNGYTMTHRPCVDHEEWSLVTFELNNKENDDRVDGPSEGSS